MVNSEDFSKRLEELMNYYALSASAFADSLSIGRSSISHILSGRNKPSLDFVLKITERYNEVELEWLLQGKGTFPASKQTAPPVTSSPPVSVSPQVPAETATDTAQDLFSEPASTPVVNTPVHAPTAPSSHQVPDTSAPVEAIKKAIVPFSNDIDRIVIFFSDGTFTSYCQKKSQ
ncbi:helix-turn-helix domain-containing protein [Aquimarina hainanensis]|uniref:Helix-turn-helix domain-containing protein n=1 Tax=Aquimarina hainanensis TaxID=1578017 RepID=A0ABW5NFR3_9FLAO